MLMQRTTVSNPTLPIVFACHASLAKAPNIKPATKNTMDLVMPQLYGGEHRAHRSGALVPRPTPARELEPQRMPS